MSAVTADQIFSRMVIRQFSELAPIVWADNADAKVVEKLLVDAKAAAAEIAYLANMQGYNPQLGGVTDFRKCVLVHFRGLYAGTQDTEVKRVVQLPQTFTELKEFIQINEANVELRQKIAAKFGFLLIGPDEQIGIEYAKVDGYLFSGAYENNDRGVCRESAELQTSYAGLDYFARPVAISDLDITKTKGAIENLRGKLWATSKYLSTTQMKRIEGALTLLEAHLKVAPPERTDTGAIIRRSFIENGNTESTARMRPMELGWKHYPTSQDAWYFGVWINPRSLETLCYAEQDVTHIQCENFIQFQRELRRMAFFHGQKLEPSSYCYGEEGTSLVFDCLTLAYGNCTTVSFHGTGKIDQEKPRLSQAPFMVDVRNAALPSCEDMQAREQKTIVLERYADFDANLLDPRSYQSEVTAKATHLHDSKWRLVVMVGETVYETEFVAEALATA